MRDRLIELFEEWEKQDEVDSIADYLLENGVIAPPCKVGDLLFCIIADKSCNEVYKHIEACRINEISYFSGDEFVFGVREVNKHYGHNVTLGKNAFKTFEEAEDVLRRCNNG